MRESSSYLNRIKDDVCRDGWFRRVFPYVPRVNFTQPIVIPPFWSLMMSDDFVQGDGYSHESMIVYQLKHVFDDKLVIRSVHIRTVGRGLFVAMGHELPTGYVFGLWGAIGLRSCHEFVSIQPERLVDLYSSEYGNLSFVIHPACIPGFINSSRGAMGGVPNCSFHVVEQCYREYGVVRWKKDLFIQTTRRIHGGEQLLMDYDYV